jgi:diketogulonate reductase-like aldo/keto reductase
MRTRKAIRESGLGRSELFVTTKYGSGPILQTAGASLAKVCFCHLHRESIFINYLWRQQLGLKQVDLYLIHNSAAVEYDFEAAWKELEKIKDTGLAK